VSDEDAVIAMARKIKASHGKVEALLNNAGIASMNHALLTPASTVNRILQTNVVGTFLFCREMSKLMRHTENGRIINFTTVAHPLNLEGEAIYAASKAAVESLTRILARELAELKITVNAIGPTPIETDLIRGVPQEKMDALLARQALSRMGEVRDVINAVDFYLREESDFITGQVLYLGGIN
jgi:3-oxoacyl-[acyl-carrier protein] reductase